MVVIALPALFETHRSPHACIFSCIALQVGACPMVCRRTKHSGRRMSLACVRLFRRD